MCGGSVAVVQKSTNTYSGCVELNAANTQITIHLIIWNIEQALLYITIVLIDLCLNTRSFNIYFDILAFSVQFLTDWPAHLDVIRAKSHKSKRSSFKCTLNYREVHVFISRHFTQFVTV